MYNKLKTAEGAEIILARRGQSIVLDASTTLRILFPDSDPSEMETNTSSIVFQLMYGDSVFMFTGDSPKSIEEYLVLVEGESLKSDVLKLGHHGSRTSTSELYLDEVQPTVAIVSAGKDNSYGHPHVEVTDLLFNKRVQMLETSKEGTITMLSDGKTVWQE
jgi:competence protein ComEC